VTLALVACSPAARPSAREGPLCTESKARLLDPGLVVIVNMENDPILPAFLSAWAYAPSAITAKVGQAIIFTNRDSDTQHSAALDSGACATDYLDPGKSDSLAFNVPGSYPFHCLVHGTAMSGTITIVP
jgi:hypothetical protein